MHADFLTSSTFDLGDSLKLKRIFTRLRHQIH